MKRLMKLFMMTLTLGMLVSITGCTSAPTLPPTPTQSLLPTEKETPTETVEATPIVEVTPTPVPTEKPTPIPSPTELPTPTATATPSPTPLPTSTPTPTVAPTATPIPVESSLYEYEIQRGENVWYRFTEDTLYVTGTGKVDDWEGFGYTNKDQELRTRLDKVKIIIIEDGITEIGKYAFAETCSAEELYLPQTLIFIEKYAFLFSGRFNATGEYKVVGLDKNRITIEECAFMEAGIKDDELTAAPTPTPTPAPIPAPKAEEVDANNPKIIANVQMGDNVWFEFYDTGELYVKGSGKTWDFKYGFNWTRNYLRDKYPHVPVFTRDYADNLKACYVSEEVTYLGNETFCGLSFDEIYIPNTTTKSGDSCI